MSSAQGAAARERSDVVCEACTGTVDLYHQHIFVFTGDAAWPARVEDKTGGIPMVAKMAEAVKKQSAGSKDEILFKVSAVEGFFQGESPAQPGMYDVLLFPSALRFRASEDDVEELVESFRSFSAPFSSLSIPPDGRIQGEPLLDDTHLFVCVHASRDVRCGEIGPLLVESIQTELKKLETPAADSPNKSKRVRVYGVSHLGGHKFAGNLVAYPQGDWYGNLDARSEALSQLLPEILSGGDPFATEALARHWRGRIGHNKDEQLYLFHNRFKQ